MFLDDNELQVQYLKNILLAFESVSGLRINFRKSTMVGIGQLHNGEMCADLFGCSLSQLPLNYLEIPLGSKSKCKVVWAEIIQNFHKKLAGWKRTYLSKGQRLIMIQSVLASLPVYYLSLFQLPVSVAKEMEKIMRNFLWGSSNTVKKKSWVGWSKANLPKCRGGVGIRKL